MMKKIKYHKAAEFGDLTREEESALQRWTHVCIALAVVMLLAAAVGMMHPVLELGESVPAGFALWFLLCCAYPVLGLLGLFNMIFGLQETAFMRFLTQDHQIFGVVVIDFVTLLVVALIGRFGGLRLLGTEKLRVCANFLLILVGWGIFQLLLFGASTVWGEGGFRPLHSHLKKEDPDRVIVVNAATPEADEKTVAAPAAPETTKK